MHTEAEEKVGVEEKVESPSVQAKRMLKLLRSLRIQPRKRLLEKRSMCGILSAFTVVHMDEAMYQLRTRVMKNPVTFIGCNYLVCDTMFVELINTWAESGDMTNLGDLQPYFNERLPIGCTGTPLISYEGFVSVPNVL
ncbi:PREDICTED: uncharacterized protein LOC104809152 [Tarenaya hassleriana]|uniref:uncharacterized protein LOC104809152 n=1 Tax=Tarenaya hassleriana TaxID=28532 RepID=UPI00053C16CA|nr:PREDICTED: uncharacterized protein LOC104809152 [Tarenaya hassleriana]